MYNKKCISYLDAFIAMYTVLAIAKKQCAVVIDSVLFYSIYFISKCCKTLLLFHYPPMGSDTQFVNDFSRNLRNINTNNREEFSENGN